MVRPCSRKCDKKPTNVAQVVRQGCHLVCRKVVLICAPVVSFTFPNKHETREPTLDDSVQGWSTGAQETLMAEQVELPGIRNGDRTVHVLRGTICNLAIEQTKIERSLTVPAGTL